MIRKSKINFYNKAISENQNVNYLWKHLKDIKPLSHQSGVLTAFPQRLKKLQNAEVRAVQTPATL